jgi:hypothetical protein
MYLPNELVKLIYNFVDINMLMSGILVNHELYEYINGDIKLWLKFNFIKGSSIYDMIRYVNSIRYTLCIECISNIGYYTVYDCILCKYCMNLSKNRLIKHKDAKHKYMIQNIDLIELIQYYGRLNNVGKMTDLYREEDVIKVAVKVHKGVLNLLKITNIYNL